MFGFGVEDSVLFLANWNLQDKDIEVDKGIRINTIRTLENDFLETLVTKDILGRQNWRVNIRLRKAKEGMGILIIGLEADWL